MSTNAMCPRCQATTIDTHCTSPIPGVWSVYGCSICLYTWRSTEPDENTNPACYPEVFRLSTEDLTWFEAVPPIASVRQVSDDSSH